MKKYRLGLLILGLITIGLTIYIATLGLSTRQDVKTEKSIEDVGNKLNSYIDREQEIPESLDVVGARDVPSTITYTKLSEKEYKLCATYKAAKGYGSGDISSVVTGAIFSRYYGYDSSLYEGSEDYKPASYYPSYTHKKGQDCQTIAPYFQQDYSSTFDDEEYCSPEGMYYQYYKDYCVDGQLQFNY